MYVRDAMLEDPVTTTPDEPFHSLLERVVSSRQATAAVLDTNGRLLGVVGIHDILRKVVPHYVDMDPKLMEVLHEAYLEDRIGRLADLRVADFMSTELDTVSPGDSLARAAGIVVEKKRKTLPVVEDGRFVGMITRRTLLECVVERMRGPRHDPGTGRS